MTPLWSTSLHYKSNVEHSFIQTVILSFECHCSVSVLNPALQTALPVLRDPAHLQTNPQISEKVRLPVTDGSCVSPSLLNHFISESLCVILCNHRVCGHVHIWKQWAGWLDLPARWCHHGHKERRRLVDRHCGREDRSLPLKLCQA